MHAVMALVGLWATPVIEGSVFVGQGSVDGDEHVGVSFSAVHQNTQGFLLGARILAGVEAEQSNPENVKVYSSTAGHLLLGWAWEAGLRWSIETGLGPARVWPETPHWAVSAEGAAAASVPLMTVLGGRWFLGIEVRGHSVGARQPSFTGGLRFGATLMDRGYSPLNSTFACPPM